MAEDFEKHGQAECPLCGQRLGFNVKNQRRKVCMPLKKNVPEGKPEWSLVQCPECGNWCWRSPLVEEAEKSGAIALCKECALWKGEKHEHGEQNFGICDGADGCLQR